MLAPGKQAGRQESPSTHLPPHFLPTGAATARRTLLLILTPTGMTWKTRSAQEVSHILCLLSCTVARTGPWVKLVPKCLMSLGLANSESNPRERHNVNNPTAVRDTQPRDKFPVQGYPLRKLRVTDHAQANSRKARLLRTSLAQGD